MAVAVGGQGVISRAWHEFETQNTAAVGSDPAVRLTTTGGTRKAVWDSALDAFDAHPWGGVGPGTFEFWWAHHATVRQFTRDAHSLYLEQLAELGVPGLLALLAFLGTVLWLALRTRWRARRSSDVAAATALCAVGVVFLVQAGIDWLWEETAVGVLGIGALAVAAAAGSERRAHRLAWRGSRLALLAASILALLVLVPGLVSSAREGQSEAALRAGRLDYARTLASAAIDAQNWAATPYQERAAVEVRQGDLHRARSDLEAAARNEPVDWRQHLQLSQVEIQLDRLAAAHRDYEMARAMNRVSFAYTKFLEFQRAVAPRCLVLGPLACRPSGIFNPPSTCLAVPAVLAGALACPARPAPRSRRPSGRANGLATTLQRPSARALRSGRSPQRPSPPGWASSSLSTARREPLRAPPSN